MSMTEWAKKEIELACKNERGDKPESEWDYGCACYESALKAFNSLCEDGHSGMSIGLTKNILNRLIDGKPLTPIEDTEDVWEYVWDYDGKKSYQCNRMGSLFKDVSVDGIVSYHDNDRVYCIDIEDENNTWMSSFIRKIIDEMFPITMPYMPTSKSYRVYCTEFLTDQKNGDFDTIGVHYCITPEDEKVEINRYFAEDEGGLKEVTKAEFLERKKYCNAMLGRTEVIK